MTTLIARYSRSLLWLLASAGLLALAGCRQSYRYERVAVTPFPTLPDTIHGPAGPISVHVVDSIAVTEDGVTIGRYDFFARAIYIKKSLGPMQRRKTLEHELCHAILLDTGLHNHFNTVGWLVELMCDNIAAVRVAELTRGSP